MKTLRYYTVLLAVLGFMVSSCEKDLLQQTNPNAITTDSFWKTEGDFEVALNAVYSALQFPAISGSGISFEVLRTDFAGTEVWYDRHLTFTNHVWHDATVHVEDRWSQLYIGVFRANQVLYYLSKVSDPDFTEEEKTLMEAEVRFVRAFCYFHIAHSYNGAVIHDELAITDEDLKKTFSSKEDVISQVVVPDLEFAAANLPKTWTADEKGKASWGASVAMLGKTHLYNKAWTEAATYFKMIIDEAENNNLYALTSDYMENFTLEGEHNSESIFEVNFSDDYKPGVSGDRHDDVLGDPGSEATSLASSYASLFVGGYNTTLPTYWLQELYVAGDSIDVANPMNNGWKYSRRTYASILVEFGDGLYYNSPLTPDVAAGDKDKTNFNYGQGAKVKKYTNWYWADSEDNSTQARTGINFRHIRLADVYLMYAEAILERDGASAISEAVKYIDVVRSRAGVILLQSYIDNNGGRIPELHRSKFANGYRSWAMANTSEALLTHIRMVERPLELAFEGHRWYDLVRWGIIEDTFKDRRAEEIKIEEILGNPIPSEADKIYPLYLNERVRLDFIIPSSNYSSSVHDYYPIPSVEIQANNNLNN